MKVSVNWLREWINPSLSTQELADQLTMAGLEVGSLQPAAPPFDGVVIGHIATVEPHPNAERLSICQVEVGEAKPLTIVTNAQVAPKMRLAVAKIGAHLPGIHLNDEKLAPVDMRGVQSEGMLCSSQELGMEINSKGLWTFGEDVPIGADLWEFLKLSDTLIDLELTPNRGDCCSVLGVARELSILNKMPLTPVKITPVAQVISDKRAVTINDPEECSRYVGRIIKGIRQTSLPIEIQEKLRRSDIRSVHPVVDILNYVMLELGQPMHAFDANKIQGALTVRFAKPGESITVLGGQTITLPDETLVIADDNQPQAIAGIIGGAESAVSTDTTDIFLESALFTAERIAGKARKMGLHTESSYRFERGVDPQLQVLAIERATKLICDYCGGQPGPVVESVQAEKVSEKAEIEFRPNRFRQVMGDDVEQGDMLEILERLRCVVLNKANDVWKVIPPSFRYDINEEIDLIEEIARVLGYGAFKEQMPISHLAFNSDSQTEVSDARLKRLLVDLGYQEAITYSFVDDTAQKRLFPDTTALKLVNPISSDMGVMRLSVWPGLLNAVLYNQNRQQTRLKFFEIGQCFNQDDSTLVQEDKLGAVVCGDAFAENWDVPKRKVDFYDLKGHVETLFKTIGQTPEGTIVS